MKKHLTLLVLFITLSAIAWGQNKALTGKVTSSDDGSALGQVDIQVLGKEINANSNEDGTYKIEGIKETDILVFSLSEYIPQEVIMGKSAVINIAMIPEYPKPYHVKIPILPGKNKPVYKTAFTSEHVNGHKISQSAANNVISALTGLHAGINITHPDGVIGGTTRITIRGNDNIMGNNQPLIVIDGMPIENNPGMVNPSGGKDWGSEINHLMAVDISSVDIIKGNAASAYYGPQAANGAILISTKSGTRKPGLGVTYNFTYNIETPYRYRETQNKYGAGAPTSLNTPELEVDSKGNLIYPTQTANDSLILPNGYSTVSNEFGNFGTSSSWGPEMNGQEITWWDGTTKTWSAQPDNIKIPFTNGTMTQHNLSVEGGNERTSIRLSISRVDGSPIVYNSNFNQTNIRLSSLIKASDKLKINISAGYLDYYRQNSPMLGNDSASIGRGSLYSWPRSYKGDDFHNYQNANSTRTDLTGIPYGNINPYFWWEYQKHNTELFRSMLTSTVVAIYNPTDWLKFVCSTGINFGYDRWETRNQPINLIGLEGGHFAKKMGRTQSNNSSFLIAMKKDKIADSKIGVNFSAGGSSLKVNNYSEGGNSGTWYFPNKYTFSNLTETSNTTIGDLGSLVASTETIYKRKQLSIYSFLNLSYDNFLYIDVTGRNDWSSTMPSDNNSYFYPSVSANFVISNVLNLDKDMISYWNIRGGFYQTKIDANPYLLDWSYSSSTFGNNQATVFSGIVPDANLKPQQTNSIELGTFAEFYNSLFTLDLTFYHSKTSDQIISSPTAASTGAYIINSNIGSVSNTGIELALAATLVKNNDLYYNTGLTFAKNSNKILDLGGADYMEIGNFDGENSPSLCVKVGEQYGTIYGYDYQYIDDQPVVSDDGTHYLISDTKVPMGNIAPKFQMGWTHKLKYKNISLFALVDSKFGGQIYSGSYVYALQSGQSPETLLERDGGGLEYTSPDGTTSNTGVILDGVHADGTENETTVHYYYKYMSNSGGYEQNIARTGIVENSYIKLRELTLSYSLPKDLIKKTKFLQDMSVKFTCRNVAYLYTTLPDNINPEGILGAGNVQAFEYGAMPATRTFSFGITAKF